MQNLQLSNHKEIEPRECKVEPQHKRVRYPSWDPNVRHEKRGQERSTHTEERRGYHLDNVIYNEAS